MKYLSLTQTLCISLLATFTLHSKVVDEFYKKIGAVTEVPSNFCCRHVQDPLKRAANAVAPHVPNWHADITLPILSCALYTLSKQIVPQIQETKKIKGNCHVKAGINAFSMMLLTANVHDTWQKNPYSFDWWLGNGISTLLLTANARSIYKTYAPTN